MTLEEECKSIILSGGRSWQGWIDRGLLEGRTLDELADMILKVHGAISA